MNPLQEMVLIGELVLQAKIALRAGERLTSVEDAPDKIEVICSLQCMLGSAGNVSKILWPVNEKHKGRGEQLRKILSIKDNNILSNRTFRNHMEHYDERIDTWFKEKSSAVYTDWSMNPSLNKFQSMSAHRGYNSYNNTMLFRGKLLDLDEVFQALVTLIEKCRLYTLV